MVNTDARTQDRVERDPRPTGYIIVDGQPMAFWLPAGVKPASIGVTPVMGKKVRHNS